MEIITLKKYPDDWLIVLDGQENLADACRQARNILTGRDGDVQAVAIVRNSKTLVQSYNQISTALEKNNERSTLNFMKYSDSVSATNYDGKYLYTCPHEDFFKDFGPDIADIFNALTPTFPELSFVNVRQRIDLFDIHIDQNRKQPHKDDNLPELNGGLNVTMSTQGGGSLIIQSRDRDLVVSDDGKFFKLAPNFNLNGRPVMQLADGDIGFIKGRHWQSPTIHSPLDTYGRQLTLFGHPA